MSAYVIMNVGTERLYSKGFYSTTSYEREQDAKAQCTRLNKQHGDTKQWVYMSCEEWNARPVKMKKVRNLMSGTEIEIAEDTPLCCDPSSETYWCM